jgi:hypothetical protein
VAVAFILPFNTQTMHIKLFFTQQHCYDSVKTLHPSGFRTQVGATLLRRHPNYRPSKYRHLNCRPHNVDITSSPTLLTLPNLIPVGYHISPGVTYPLRGQMKKNDVFSNFVDILTVGNLDVDIGTYVYVCSASSTYVSM